MVSGLSISYDADNSLVSLSESILVTESSRETTAFEVTLEEFDPYSLKLVHKETIVLASQENGFSGSATVT